MSLYPQPIPPVPGKTVRVARAAFSNWSSSTDGLALALVGQQDSKNKLLCDLPLKFANLCSKTITSDKLLGVA